MKLITDKMLEQAERLTIKQQKELEEASRAQNPQKDTRHSRSDCQKRLQQKELQRTAAEFNAACA